MSTHLTKKEQELPQSENRHTRGRGDDLFCGWKQLLSWGEKVSEKGVCEAD